MITYIGANMKLTNKELCLFKNLLSSHLKETEKFINSNTFEVLLQNDSGKDDSYTSRVLDTYKTQKELKKKLIKEIKNKLD